jgi:hypothetical protein
MSEVGVHTIDVAITDIKATVTNSFTLTVTNQAPNVIASTVPTEITATFKVDYTYTLPSSTDPEGLSYTTTILSGPSYATVLSNTQLRVYPVNCATDFGVKTITIKLEDQQPLSTTYSFNIKVPNSPPSFTGGLMPEDQTV